VEEDLRQDRRRARTARPRLDRPGTDQGVRGQDRTIEPNVFKQYFLEKAKAAVGADQAGSRFIGVTDPKTKMNEIAKKDRFRHIFFGLKGIGGRFSALSNFGMIPLAVMGVDVMKFLDSTEIMVQACASCVPPELNPGVILGVIMGTLAKNGRDKVTVITSPGISSLGAWLEQLMAESTGKAHPVTKQGMGLIPIDGERVGPPEAYGKDRLFVYERLASAPRQATPWYASAWLSRWTSARRCSAGRSPRPWPARSSASTRSISPTSRRPRWRPGA
jgi:hypothetical protein